MIIVSSKNDLVVDTTIIWYAELAKPPRFPLSFLAIHRAIIYDERGRQQSCGREKWRRRVQESHLSALAQCFIMPRLQYNARAIRFIVVAILHFHPFLTTE